ncbi:hypothetical protein J2W22_001569 [Sphingomonas kyeonggiensis]|nr:hypothetical protein [Sphingomonas kyeonggiensis]
MDFKHPVHDASLGRASALVMRHPEEMERRRDLLAPLIEKLEQRRKVRRPIVLLPDEQLKPEGRAGR